MLYFDHCATTPPYEEVVEAVAEAMRRFYGNPSSIHRVGIEAERLLAKARETAASLLGTAPERVVFTSGGTESNNMAVLGAARTFEGRGKHLVTTGIEHPSVYEAFRYLERDGWEVTYVQPQTDGIVPAEAVLNAIRDDTVLVSVMHVNNEIGAIQPIEPIARALQARKRVLFHVDAVQSFGKLSVQPERWGVDMLSVSGHKIRGPKGAGLLYVRKGLNLEPIVHGGGQEWGLRSGTENVAAIAGFVKAMRLTLADRERAAAHLTRLRHGLLERLHAVPGLVYNGSEDERLMAPHIVHFSAPGLKSEVIVHALEERGVCVSTRSACSSASDRPSRVLLAMGAEKERAASGIRISMSAAHSETEIVTLADAVKDTIDHLRRLQ